MDGVDSGSRVVETSTTLVVEETAVDADSSAGSRAARSSARFGPGSASSAPRSRLIVGSDPNNEEASFSMEARSLENTKLKSIIKQVDDIAKKIVKSYNAKADIKKIPEYSGYSIRKNDKIIRILDDAMKKIKISPIYETSGGGSDTNIINKAKIKAVNLSIGMKEIHTKKEYININDLISGTKLVLSIIGTVYSA